MLSGTIILFAFFSGDLEKIEMAAQDLKSAATAFTGTWAFGMLVLLCAIAASFVIPFAALVISPMLIVSGYSLYRKDTDTVMRSLALGAIVSGIAIILLYVLFLILVGVIGGTVSVSSSTVEVISTGM